MLAIPSRVIASCFALVCFAAAAVQGLAVGNTLFTIIGRSTVVMLVAWCVGTLIGAVAQRTVDQHIDDYRQANPIPEEEPVSDDDSASLVTQADNAGASNPPIASMPTAAGDQAVISSVRSPSQAA